MAFSKKTWKNRVSEQPQRRLLTPTDGGSSYTVDVTRQEGIVVEEGDAFSAQNMNDLESRIKNTFDADEATLSSVNTKANTNATNIASLQSNMTNLSGRVSTNASNITSLSNRMTTAEGKITTNTSNIAGLSSRMGTAESNITSLGNRMTVAEGNITSLSNRMGTAEGNITSQGNSISSLNSRMGTAESSISSLTSRANNHERDLNRLLTTRSQNLDSHLLTGVVAEIGTTSHLWYQRIGPVVVVHFYLKMNTSVPTYNQQRLADENILLPSYSGETTPMVGLAKKDGTYVTMQAKVDNNTLYFQTRETPISAGEIYIGSFMYLTVEF